MVGKCWETHIYEVVMVRRQFVNNADDVMCVASAKTSATSYLQDAHLIYCHILLSHPSHQEELCTQRMYIMNICVMLLLPHSVPRTLCSLIMNRCSGMISSLISSTTSHRWRSKPNWTLDQLSATKRVSYTTDPSQHSLSSFKRQPFTRNSNDF